MPTIKVSVSLTVNGQPQNEELSFEVVDADVTKYLPRGSGHTGWPHYDEAADLVASLLGQKFFPDEMLPMNSLRDLKRLGVTVNTATFSDHAGNEHKVTFLAVA